MSIPSGLFNPALPPVIGTASAIYARTRLQLHRADPEKIGARLHRKKIKKIKPRTYVYKGEHYTELNKFQLKVVLKHHKVVKIPEKKILPKGNTKIMPKGRKYTKKSKKRSRIARTPFPGTKVITLKSTHQVQLNPGATDATSILSLNPNNLLDPVNASDSVTMTQISTEKHPRYYAELENVYERFRVIGFSYKFTILSNNQNQNLAIAVCQAANPHVTEVKAILGDTVTFATRLIEAVKGAKVVWVSNSSGLANFKRNMSIKGNEKTMLSHDQKLTDANVGKTAASDSEAAPSATPRVWLTIGAIGSGSVDLNPMDVIVEQSQIVLFTGLQGDKEGTAV